MACIRTDEGGVTQFMQKCNSVYYGISKRTYSYLNIPYQKLKVIMTSTFLSAYI